MRVHRVSKRLACAVVMMSGRSAPGQLLPQVPPKPEPAAEYVPPVAPARQAAPKEPEVAAPALIARDAAGKLKTYDLPLEEVAVGLMTLPEESRAKRKNHRRAAGGDRAVCRRQSGEDLAR